MDIKGESILSFHINLVADNLYAIQNYVLLQQSDTILIYRYRIKNAKNGKSEIMLTKIKRIENHVMNYLVHCVSRQVLCLLFNVMLTLVSRNVKACNRELEKIILWMKIGDIVDVHVGECVKVWDRYGVVKTYYNEESGCEQRLEQRDGTGGKSGKKNKHDTTDGDAKETVTIRPSNVPASKLVNDDFVLECRNSRLRMNYFKRSFVENFNLVNVIDFVCVGNTVFVLLKNGVEVLIFN